MANETTPNVFENLPTVGVHYSYVYDSRKGLFFMVYGNNPYSHQALVNENNLQSVVAAGNFVWEGDELKADRLSKQQDTAERLFRDTDLPLTVVFSSLLKLFPETKMKSVHSIKNVDIGKGFRDGD